MKTLKSLPDLWQQYFVAPPRIRDLDSWAIVFLALDEHQLLVSLANPLRDKHQEVFVDAVSAHDVATFIVHYKQRFLEQLPARFGLFRPDVDRVLTEYPDWQTFYDAWLDDDAKLVQGNMPLLFDYPSQQEYRAMRLKDADYAGYRRLQVVLYQYRKQQFQKVFIKAVDDASYARIQQQIQALYAQLLPELILNTIQA